MDKYDNDDDDSDQMLWSSELRRESYSATQHPLGLLVLLCNSADLKSCQYACVR